MKLWVRNVLLAMLAVGIVVIPLFFIQGAEWGATDGRNTEAIQELQPDYEPWFEPFFYSAEFGLERYMFGLQALLGSFVLSACLGWLIGRYRGDRAPCRGQRPQDGDDRLGRRHRVATALLFVQTEFGELQAFITAVQGVLLGFLGFFAGYPLGERYGKAHPRPGSRADRPWDRRERRSGAQVGATRSWGHGREPGGGARRRRP